VCGTKLFESTTKYDSGSGWPSFWKAIETAVDEKSDVSHGMVRTEVTCKKCQAHLGHGMRIISIVILDLSCLLPIVCISPLFRMCVSFLLSNRFAAYSLQ
jgi:SelR domain